MLAEDIRYPEKQPIVFKRKWGKIKKTKKETKEVGTELHPGKGVLKREKFPNTRKPSHQRVCGEFWNLRGEHNWEGEKHTHTHTEYTLNPNCRKEKFPAKGSNLTT